MKKNIIIKACFASFAVYLLSFVGIQAQEKKDSLVNVAFGTVANEDLLGAVSSVNISDLLTKSYSTNSLDEIDALVGGYNGNIWGQSPLILVDGVPRSSWDIRATEVSSVTVLKGANAVALYGSKGAKGVILITTKRGEVKPLDIAVRANTGFYFPKNYPSYLNAADYMTLYNEALANDEKDPKYTQEVIDGTSAGLNPYRYPDVDFFSSDYLKKTYNQTDVTTEISGGNEKARYYSNFGMTYNNSIMNYGEHKNNKDLRFNVRANVDMDLTKWLSASSDVAVVFTDSYTGLGNFWGSSTTLRPNWFSPLVPMNMLDQTNEDLLTLAQNSSNIIDGNYLLGGREGFATNIFADMLAGGYAKNKNRTFQFNARLNANLSSILEGLSFNAAYSMDYRNFYSEIWANTYAVYEPTWSTIDNVDVITSLKQYGTDVPAYTENIGGTTNIKTISFSGQFDYNRVFAEHHYVNAKMMGWGYQISNAASGDNASSLHHNTNANLGFQANYNFRKKYYFDFTGALVHSAKLDEGNRNAFSPTATVAWRLSNEDFFKNNVGFVENLKINASYGQLNQDIDISDFYLADTQLSHLGGWFTYRDGGYGGNTSAYRRTSNPGLTFIQREEMRIGLEASMLDKLISLDANYFSQNTNGMLVRGNNTIYPSYLANGDDNMLPYINYNNDNRTGIDFTVNLNKKFGEFDINLGLAGMYFTSEATKRDELNEPKNKHLDRTGKPIDAYYGYVALGFFENEQDVLDSPEQRFGSTLKPGDIKYKDINGDGWIDDNDQINLGHTGWSVAPFTYGTNLTVKWKNLVLYAAGSGIQGAIGIKNSSYYWVRGEAKYSEVVKGRWTEASKNTATYPRLTTTDDSNNFRNSTFWQYKTDNFRLDKVQITYNFPQSMFNENSLLSEFSMYVNGFNLLTVSKEQEMMETNIGSQPQYRFFNLGLKASF
jgi:TonB-linked SusC/RagA family outer membrane protein